MAFSTTTSSRGVGNRDFNRTISTTNNSSSLSAGWSSAPLLLVIVVIEDYSSKRPLAAVHSIPWSCLNPSLHYSKRSETVLPSIPGWWRGSLHASVMTKFSVSLQPSPSWWRHQKSSFLHLLFFILLLLALWQYPPYILYVYTVIL
jgi:hypothetical protein